VRRLELQVQEAAREGVGDGAMQDKGHLALQAVLWAPQERGHQLGGRLL
jgi:hypothetical protein